MSLLSKEIWKFNNISTEVEKAMLKYICNHRNSKKLKQFWGRRAKPEALHYLIATSTSKLFGQNQNNIRITKHTYISGIQGPEGILAHICNPVGQENLEFKSGWVYIGRPCHRNKHSTDQTKNRVLRNKATHWLIGLWQRTDKGDRRVPSTNGAGKSRGQHKDY